MVLRHHPNQIVEHYINADPDPQNWLIGLKKIAPPDCLKSQAIIALQEVSLEQRPFKEVEPLLERAYQQQSHVDLHILFLLAWLRILRFLESNTLQTPLVKVLDEQVRSLISDSTPPELKAGYLFMRHSFELSMGDVMGTGDLLSKVRALLPVESPHFQRIALVWAINLLHFGRGVEIQELLRHMPAQIGEVFERRLVVARYINAAVTGDLATALEIQPFLEQGLRHIDFIFRKIDFEVARYTVELMTTTNSAVEIAGEPAWVTSTRALLANKPEQALEWARQSIKQRRPEQRQNTLFGFDEYALMRAELACGHWEAARDLLRQRNDNGSIHYIDDLFLGRIALLSGDETRASFHLNLLREKTAFYRATGRADFEIKLSPELSPTRVLGLTKKPVERVVVPEPKVESPKGLARIISSSPQMAIVKERTLSFADLTLPVLVTGETGTGKELIASALHEESIRRSEPFLAVNCGVLSEALIESELFGHKRGSFTGAERTRRGLFLEAGKGTLFLDEIGEIPPKLQVSLLRVLEEGEVRPVGSSESIKIHCRIVAATNVNLEALSERGGFRSDLLYRLKRLELHLPPLRERPDDIIAIAQRFLNLGGDNGQRAVLSPELIERLKSHPWPGNVRELRNVIEKMRILNSGKLFYAVGDIDLPPVKSQAKSERAAEVEVAAEVSGEEKPQSGPAESGVTSMGAPVSAGTNAIADLLRNEPSALRRTQVLRDLFKEHKVFKVYEIAKVLKVSRSTAGRYLNELCKEGFIKRVEPSASPRSHYYRVSDC